MTLREFEFRVSLSDGTITTCTVPEISGEAAEMRVRQTIPHARTVTLIRGTPKRKQLSLDL